MRPLILLSALCWFAAPSLAAIVEFRFAGVIDAIDDPDHDFGGAVQPGDPVAATFLFDTTLLVDENPQDPGHGIYRVSQPSTLMLPSISATGCPCNPAILQVEDDVPTGYDVLVFGASAFAAPLNWTVTLAGPTTLFFGDAFPAQLHEFTSMRIWVWMPDSPASMTSIAYGTITSAVIVPDPHSLILLACVLPALIRGKGKVQCGTL